MYLPWGGTHGKHLIGFVKDEHLDVVGLQDTTLDHVLDTAGSTNDDLGTILESLHVITNVGTTNASMALNAHEVANGDDDLLNLLSQLTSGSQDQSLAGLEGAIDLLQG